MIRLLGFLVGSAVSIGAILLLLGVPELNLSNPHLDKERFEEALQQLRNKQLELEAAAATQPAERPESESDNQSAVSTDAVADLPQPQSMAQQDSPDKTQVPLTDLPAPADELHWHTFWNPFHSEIAARGFVSQLERVTGLDYRVIKVKTGVYEVAFAYESDVDRQARLSQIQAATGLDLPGS